MLWLLDSMVLRLLAVGLAQAAASGAQCQLLPAHAQAIWYAFFAQPAPAIGLLDFYLFGPLANVLDKKWSVDELTLRDRMGGGNFGQVYEGVISPPGELGG
jgi:hypothetical protein